ATDGVLENLRRSDVHATAALLGTGAAGARAELRTVADELDEAGRPVKLALVAGRGDNVELLKYARRLREELDFAGTVVLVTPGGSTAAAGPAPSAETTARLRRAR